MAIIHNPNATNPIQVGYLPADSEYKATTINENEYLLETIKS